MTGNTAYLVFNDFRSGNNTVLNCFKDHPETYKKFLGLFTILTNIDTLLCSPGEKTIGQREKTAEALEDFGRYFPVNFYRNLTRKMHILSIIAPEQVRSNGNFYKYLKLEQETERAHHVLNLLEIRFECVKNKAMKYFLMLKAFKNIQKTDLGLLKTRHSYKKVNKNN